MKSNKAIGDYHVPFFTQMGFLIIILLIFGLPAVIISLQLHLFDPFLSILLLVITLLSIPFYSIVIILFAPHGESYTNFLFIH